MYITSHYATYHNRKQVFIRFESTLNILWNHVHSWNTVLILFGCLVRPLKDDLKQRVHLKSSFLSSHLHHHRPEKRSSSISLSRSSLRWMLAGGGLDRMRRGPLRRAWPILGQMKSFWCTIGRKVITWLGRHRKLRHWCLWNKGYLKDFSIDHHHQQGSIHQLPVEPRILFSFSKSSVKEFNKTIKIITR